MKARSHYVAIVLVALVQAACAAGPATSPSNGQSSSALTTVTLRQSWIPDDLYMPFVAAIKQSFYAQEGINLVMQSGNGGLTGAQLVANGNVMIATGEAANVLVARSKGLPIISIANQIQDLPAVVISKKATGIITWQDLVGKSVAGTSGTATVIEFQTALRLQGIDPEQVRFVNIPPDSQFQALLSGNVDAAITFKGNMYSLPDQGADFSALSLKSGGILAPSTSMFVTESTLADHRDLLLRFVRATIKGMRYAIENPDQVADLVASDFPGTSASDILGKWKINTEFLTSSESDQHGLGWQDSKRWETLEKALLEGGAIDAHVDISKAFTNSLIDEISATR